jgi:CRISPR-associated protein Csm2
MPREHQQRGRQFGPTVSVDKKDLEVILDGHDPQKMVQIAENIAEAITSPPPNKRVTTSQIRNIFGTVKNLESKGVVTDEIISKLVLLKPKLAYAAGRHDIQALKDLAGILSDAIDLVYVQREKRFENFCKFFEAILAYHKAHGGK